MSSELQNDWRSNQHEQEHRKEKCFSAGEKEVSQNRTNEILSKKGQTRNGSLRYTLLPISVALEYYHQQQMVKLEEQARRIQVQKLLEKDEKIASNS